MNIHFGARYHVNNKMELESLEKVLPTEHGAYERIIPTDLEYPQTILSNEGSPHLDAFRTMMGIVQRANPYRHQDYMALLKMFVEMPIPQLNVLALAITQLNAAKGRQKIEKGNKQD